MFILVFPSPFLTWHSHWSIAGAWNLFKKNVCQLIIISNKKLKRGGGRISTQPCLLQAPYNLHPPQPSPLASYQYCRFQLPLSFFFGRTTQHMGSQFSHYVKSLQSALVRFENDPATAAKSLQSCPTLCNHIDGSSPGSPVPGILQARTLEWGCHFLLQCMKVKSVSEVAQSCPTLSDPMDCSLPGSSVNRIFQARVLEWGAIAFSIK